MKDIFLTKLSLSDYRNLNCFNVDLSAGVNIIIGPNGSGKTNILESISLLSPGKGLKSAKYEDILQQNKPKWQSEFNLQSKLGITQLRSEYEQEAGRKIYYNGSKIGNNELINLLNVIWITPQMDGLFLGPTANRRKFLDRLTYNFNANHAKHLNQYDHYLKERMKILLQKDWQQSASWLDSLEKKIAEETFFIQRARLQTIAEMQTAINNLKMDFPKANIALSDLCGEEIPFFTSEHSEAIIPSRLCEHSEAIQKNNKDWIAPPAKAPRNDGTLADTQSSLSKISVLDAAAETKFKEGFKEKFKQNYCQNLRNARQKDSYIGRSSIGPHKSDFIITYAEKNNLARNCSTGEQKALLICLTLAFVDSLMNKLAAKPILLLDELFVHLDEQRRKSLSEYILSNKIQTLITTTDMSGLDFLAKDANIISL